MQKLLDRISYYFIKSIALAFLAAGVVSFYFAVTKNIANLIITVICYLAFRLISDAINSVSEEA